MSKLNKPYDSHSMDEIDNLLTRGVEHIYPSKQELEKILRSNKKLRVYQGFDPTSPQFHIGHMVGLRKLKQWQDLGHEVIFLIGDFTGMIGDPTAKDKTRLPLTRKQVLENAITYKEQASKILRFEGKNPVIVRYNSEWLSKLSSQDLLKLTSYLTYQQVVERNMFQRRIKNKMDIALNEFLYPLLQGYDSVAMNVDVEVGGNDQLFNMMTGRDLMHKIKRKNKFVMTTPLLVNSRGAKFGKTTGNIIAITDRADKLFAEIMNLPDEIIINGLEWLTDIPQEEIKQIEKDIKTGKNPIDLKKRLAFEIVSQLNNPTQASDAQKEFENVFQKGREPQDLQEITVNDQILASEVVASIVGSKSEAKRLFEQGAIEINSKTEKDPRTKLTNGQVIRIGKKKFVKIRVR